jgi:fatty acid desaturase
LIAKLKAAAVAFAIAVAAVAVVIVGTFIGGVLLFLGAVALVAFIMLGLWCTYREHSEEVKKERRKQKERG